MTGNRSRLKNFMKKFIGTIRFRNDHFGAIMGYGDYVIGDSMISRKTLCYVRDVDGVELLKGSRGLNLYSISVEDMMKSSSIYLLSKASKNKSWLWHRRTPQQNDVVERQNRTLVEAARIMLLFSKAPMFLWAEAVATAWLIPNPVPAAPYVPPTNKDLDILFQPMFDEYLEPPSVERPVPHAPAAQVLVNLASTSSSTNIDQDAPSISYSPSSLEVQGPISHQGFTAGPTIEDNPFAQTEDDPFVNVFAPEPSFEASSSGDVSLSESNKVIQPHDHLKKWSKDHPIDNVIGNPSSLVSTRKQLATDALWCFYNSVLSKVEPKNFKTVMTKACLFEAM
ncbi:retrovirus-related pol polyprotein from transposon TNT 1-94 [Tanacetum coccineum]